MGKVASTTQELTGRRRVRLRVSGVVQGVGFRPFVYNLSSRLELAGYVLNDSDGVEIDLEGNNNSVDRFLSEIRTAAPPLAVIKDIAVEELSPEGATSFEIRTSKAVEDRSVLISPDYATCPDCLREMSDPKDRRHCYPFINCTNCGPRYTIIMDVPYDRTRTTMASFEMCAQCRSEYEDPSDRRFHAEPTCCPACGPQVRLTDAAGKDLDCEDPIDRCRQLLASGSIVAIKGLGGFHLACDASNDEAVGTLRQRKAREEKPLAVMVAGLERAQAVADPTAQEKEMLSAKERSILLAAKKQNHGLSKSVAAKSSTFGIMLPYTPLHHLLMQGPYSALVMTSGNITDEPIAHRNEDALERLSGIVDFFLLHDRDIHIRTDDSVVRVTAGSARFLRRSRGYAPFPVDLPFDTAGKEVLAVGGELKNTVCLTRNGSAFISHHIGDLKNAPAYGAFLQAVEHLADILQVTPHTAACDMHPGYSSTKYALNCGLPVVQVQHHHAHIASVLAEHGLTDRVQGVSFDGLGWGDDGQIWGGEFLVCDLDSYRRAGHIEYLPLPGGDATTKKPYRMAYVYLGDAARDLTPMLDTEISVVDRMITQKLNTPYTSSAGRLFDAAASALGICHENTYEGQAPMELEAACTEGEEGSYEAGIENADGKFIVRTTDVIKSMTEDFQSGTPAGVCAARFHNSVARFIYETCRAVRDAEGISTAALSGGVFANAYLLERTIKILRGDGFDVLTNSIVPTGDGGVSLGQAAVAARRSKCA